MCNGIEKLYIEPASACNLNCKMCFRHSWINEKFGFMSEKTFKHILEDVSNNKLKSVMFGGMGEPLLHKNIVRMVHSFSEQNIKTELLTNATLLTRECAEELIEAGLGTLWISVDGFDREEYEKIHSGSRFDLIMQNVEDFNKIRKNCSMGLTFVIMEDNIDNLVKINKFADDLSFEYINLSYEVPSAPRESFNSCYDTGFLTGRQERVDFSNFHPRRKNYCPFIEENNCFIKWDGEVVPCMQLLHNSFSYFYEEERRILSKSFGNVNDTRLNDIWRCNEYISFRKRVHAFDFPDCTICDGCDDRLSNKSDCMYNIFPTCGACLWAQGIGRCP